MNSNNWLMNFSSARQAVAARQAAAVAAATTAAATTSGALPVTPISQMGSSAAGNYEGEDSNPYDSFLGIHTRGIRRSVGNIFDHHHHGPVTAPENVLTDFEGDGYDNFIGLALLGKLLKKKGNKRGHRKVLPLKVRNVMDQFLQPSNGFDGMDFIGFDGDQAEVCGCDECRQEYDNFLGIAIGKKAQATKKLKSDVRAEKKRSKNEARIIKANAKLELAKQGIDNGFGTQLSKSLGSVSSIAGSLMGGGGGSEDNPLPVASTATPAAMQNGTYMQQSADGTYHAPADPFGTVTVQAQGDERLEKMDAMAAAAAEKAEKEKAEKAKQQKTMIAIAIVIIIVIAAIALFKKK